MMILVLILVNCMCFIYGQQSIVQYPFVYEHVVECSTIEELLGVIAYPGDKSIAINNVFLAIYTEGSNIGDNFSFRGAQRRFAEDLLLIATIPDNQVDFIGESGKDRYVYISKNAKLSSGSVYYGPWTEKDVSLWTALFSKARYTILNKSKWELYMNWVQEGDRERKTNKIRPYDSTSTNTFIGHAFTIRKSDDQQLLSYFIVSENEGTVVIQEEDEFDQDVNERYSKAMHELWLGLRYLKNYYQPNIVKTFTSVGFKKIKVEESLFQDILTFYHKREKNQYEERAIGPCVNQEVAKTYMITLDSRIRKRIIHEMKPVLEEWSGIELEMTSLYGIRKYTGNNELLMHVDTVDTHVISCIVNVAQDVDEDWLLEILDHDGNLHKIPMEPGDLVLYESARSLHGRPAPLKGRFYSNFFLHYKPTTTPWEYSWF